MGLGAVTVISGSCVDEVASCDMAPPHIPHSSAQPAALILSVRLVMDVIISILKALTGFVGSDVSGKLAVDVRRTISIVPLRNQPRMARRSPLGSIDPVRTRE